MTVCSQEKTRLPCKCPRHMLERNRHRRSALMALNSRSGVRIQEDPSGSWRTRMLPNVIPLEASWREVVLTGKTFRIWVPSTEHFADEVCTSCEGMEKKATNRSKAAFHVIAPGYHCSSSQSSAIRTLAIISARYRLSPHRP